MLKTLLSIYVLAYIFKMNYFKFFIILLLSTIIVFYAYKNTNVKNQLKNADFTEIVKSINEKNSKIKSTYCPEIKIGFLNKSSLFCEKNGDLLFVTYIYGTKEAMIGCEKNNYWFWIRSFDKKSIYFCKKSNLNKTNLNPIMNPEIISSMGWMREINPNSKIEYSEKGLLCEFKKDLIKIIIEFDSEKIISQKIFIDERLILTMEGKEYNYFSNHLMPTKIKAFWHEENIKETLYIDQWILNKKINTSEPKNFNRINFGN